MALSEKISKQEEKLKQLAASEEVQELKAIKEKTQLKVSMLRSIRTQILAVVALGILATAFFTYITVKPLVTEEFSARINNYMLDIAEAYGSIANQYAGTAGLDSLSTDYMVNIFNQIHIDGEDSSYAYVVKTDGTMLVHPNAEKVGKPVENAIVKQMIQDIQAGQVPETKVHEYEYKGAWKYAAIYVDVENEFLLVISAEREEITSTVDYILYRTMLGGVFSFVVCMLLAIIVAYVITKPIKQIASITSRFSTLDLRRDGKQKKLDVRKDEVGLMSKAISRLRDKLDDTVSDIKVQSSSLYQAAESLNKNANDTAVSIEQVDKAVQDVAESATAQASETQKATENVIRMGSMIEETTLEVEKLFDNASNMKTSGEEATQTLEELDVINHQAQKSIDIIYEQTNTTNESALKIREATNLITSIAEETNLLSLNASIEAARAGDQGRGFAVVASQIQKLAEQSNESARKIEEIINELIEDSSKAVQTMDEVKNIMEKQSENVSKTGEKFVQVQHGIHSSIDGVNVIAERTRMLDEIRTSVVEVVQNLTAFAEENAASTEETSASVAEVSNIMFQISESVGELKKIAEDLEEKMSEFIV